jgi:pimeloyl-ACP methyl ester carboxylesterase
MKHYILVHGAWEGPWSWDYTRPALEKQGHIVTAIDLHGRDGSSRNVTNVTLSSNVETVVNAIDQLDHKVVLVGHSMAGAVISQVAERLPEKIDKLVYVAAFLLKSGDSVIEAMKRDPDGEFLPELIFSDDQTSVTASQQTWRDKAFHDVREDRLSTVLPLVDVAQATEPFMAKVVVTDEHFGSVPKLYIRTAIDKMVSPKLQDEMLENWKVDQVHVLQSGHFPTLSMPETLAELML